jgi:hypothetical protein
MCEITTGYTLPDCRSVGGIKKFIIYNLENRSSYTVANNVVTAISMDLAKQAYQFDVEMELSNAIETGTGTRADFTFFYAQAATIILADKTQANIDLLALFNKGRLGVIAFYESGITRHFGLVNGLMVDTEVDDSGTEYGNRNGHTLTMSGKEVAKAPTIADALAEAILLPAS